MLSFFLETILLNNYHRKNKFNI